MYGESRHCTHHHNSCVGEPKADVKEDDNADSKGWKYKQGRSFDKGYKGKGGKGTGKDNKHGWMNKMVPLVVAILDGDIDTAVTLATQYADTPSLGPLIEKHRSTALIVHRGLVVVSHTTDLT
jgi:hypothetical protein